MIEDRPAWRSTGAAGLESPEESPAVRGDGEQRFAGQAVVSDGRAGRPSPIAAPRRVLGRAARPMPGASRDAAVIGGAPFLFIVSPGETERYEFVKRHFADESDVEVMYDRRRDERRRSQRRVADERRRHQSERRQDDLSQQDLRAIGWAYVRRLE